MMRPSLTSTKKLSSGVLSLSSDPSRLLLSFLSVIAFSLLFLLSLHFIGTRILMGLRDLHTMRMRKIGKKLSH